MRSACLARHPAVAYLFLVRRVRDPWLMWSFACLPGERSLLLYGFTQADQLVRAEHDFHADLFSPPKGFPFFLSLRCRPKIRRIFRCAHLCLAKHLRLGRSGELLRSILFSAGIRAVFLSSSFSLGSLRLTNQLADLFRFVYQSRLEPNWYLSDTVFPLT